MNTHLFNDRDLSWLSFNKRVLDEAWFNDLKVFDKIKFMAIHSSNLDEFARVRLAALEVKLAHGADMETTVNTETLSAARKAVFTQGADSRKVLEQLVLPQLKANGIHLYYHVDTFEGTHYEEIMHIFMSRVLSYLQPVIITQKTNIFLEDRMLYFLLDVDAGRRLHDLKIVLNIPNDALPRFFSLSPKDDTHFIVYLDDIIRVGVQFLFKEFSFKGIYSIQDQPQCRPGNGRRKRRAGTFPGSHATRFGSAQERKSVTVPVRCKNAQRSGAVLFPSVWTGRR